MKDELILPCVDGPETDNLTVQRRPYDDGVDVWLKWMRRGETDNMYVHIDNNQIIDLIEFLGSVLLQGGNN